MLALIRHLPAESAYVSSLRGTEYAGWDRHTYMQADIFDAIQNLSYLFTASKAKDPKKVAKPTPYPRPGVKQASEKKTNHLLSRLRGEGEMPAHLGPGSVIPLPPPRP